MTFQKAHLTSQQLRELFHARSDIEVVRIHYCYQIGSTFVRLALMEDAIIHAMSLCDKIRVKTRFGEDLKRWEQMLAKTKHLQDSTLGNLIRLLASHNVQDADIAYLNWVKRKRDFFIHRFFQTGAWPGEMREEDVYALVRILLYLEHIFSRAGQRIWGVFERAGLLQFEKFSDGMLAMNTGWLEDIFEESDTTSCE